MKKSKKIISFFLALALVFAGIPGGTGKAYAGNAGTSQQFFDLGGRILTLIRRRGSLPQRRK